MTEPNWALQAVKVGVQQGLIDVAQPTKWLTNGMRLTFSSSDARNPQQLKSVAKRSPDIIPAFDLAEGLLATIIGALTAFACVALALGFTVATTIAAQRLGDSDGSVLLAFVQATTFVITTLVAAGWINQGLQTYRRIDERDTTV